MKITSWIKRKQDAIKILERLRGDPGIDQGDLEQLLTKARTDLAEFPDEYAKAQGTEAQRFFDQFLSAV